MSLAGRVCIVTGAGSGIGRGAALMMAHEGARVAVIGRTAEKVEAVKAEIVAKGGISLAFALDVADYDAVVNMAKEVKDAFGRIDVLVNNAGHGSQHRRLLTTTPDELRRVIDSNLIGTIFCTQAVVPFMLEAGEGTIINVASLAGVSPNPFSGLAYGVSKSGVIGFTEFLNTDFKNTGIRASVVIPGEVNTPIHQKRPVTPPKEARELMVDVEETSAAITMIAGFPKRTNVSTLVIRPTIPRDLSKETEEAPY